MRAFLKLKVVIEYVPFRTIFSFHEFFFFFFLSKRINTSEWLIYDDEFKFQEHVEFSF